MSPRNPAAHPSAADCHRPPAARAGRTAAAALAALIALTGCGSASSENDPAQRAADSAPTTGAETSVPSAGAQTIEPSEPYEPSEPSEPSAPSAPAPDQGAREALPEQTAVAFRDYLRASEYGSACSLLTPGFQQQILQGYGQDCPVLFARRYSPSKTAAWEADITLDPTRVQVTGDVAKVGSELFRSTATGKPAGGPTGLDLIRQGNMWLIAKIFNIS